MTVQHGTDEGWFPPPPPGADDHLAAGPDGTEPHADVSDVPPPGADLPDATVDLERADPEPAATPEPADHAETAREVRDELARARTPRERFAVAARLAGVPLGGDDLVAVLDALPSGWQRLTVLRQLVRAGGLGDLDAGRVVTRSARQADRTRVASLLVDAGLAHLGTVTDHLTPAAADRLRRRHR